MECAREPDTAVTRPDAWQTDDTAAAHPPRGAREEIQSGGTLPADGGAPSASPANAKAARRQRIAAAVDELNRGLSPATLESAARAMPRSRGRGRLLDTVLTRCEFKGDSITYTFRYAHMDAREVRPTGEELTFLSRQLLEKCSSVGPVLRDGFDIVFNFVGRDGGDVAGFRMDSQACAARVMPARAGARARP